MATGFKFRLERVLQLREEQVKDCQKRVAEAMLVVSLAEQRLERLIQEQDRLNKLWWESAGSASFSGPRALPFEHAMAALATAQLKAMADIAEARTRLLERQVELDKATTKLRILEKLRERGLRRHLAEESRAEQIQLDEFSVMRQGRTQS